MLIIDPRIGSRDLVEPLRQLGVETALQHLDFGDAALIGNGPEGRPVPVGVEIKAVGDLLSCIVDRRFAQHQLPGMLANYELGYLLLEGVITAAPTRELMLLKDGKWKKAPFGERPWTYEGVESFRRSVEAAGLRTDKTADRRATACWLASLHAWWSKPWEEHRSLLGVRLKPLEASADANAFTQFEATRKMQVAATLADGIGVEKAREADKHFPSIRAMVNAGVEEWQRVLGIGKKLAARIVENVTREEIRL